MNDHNLNPSCLSAEEHDDPQNPVLHYLGCLEFCKRENYYNTLPPNYRDQIENLLRRTECLRVKASGDDGLQDLVTNLSKSFQRWRSCKQSYLKGIKEVKAWSGRGELYEEHQLKQRPAHIDRIDIAEAANSQNEPYDPDKDTSAYLIQYKDSQIVGNLEAFGFSCHSKFPNHRMPSSNLLDREVDRNPLMKAHTSKGPENFVKYFSSSSKQHGCKICWPT